MNQQQILKIKSSLFSFVIFNCVKIHWTFLASEAHLQTSEKIGISFFRDAKQNEPLAKNNDTFANF